MTSCNAEQEVGGWLIQVLRGSKAQPRSAAKKLLYCSGVLWTQVEGKCTSILAGCVQSTQPEWTASHSIDARDICTDRILGAEVIFLKQSLGLRGAREPAPFSETTSRGFHAKYEWSNASLDVMGVWVAAAAMGGPTAPRSRAARIQSHCSRRQPR